MTSRQAGISTPTLLLIAACAGRGGEPALRAGSTLSDVTSLYLSISIIYCVFTRCICRRLNTSCATLLDFYSLGCYFSKLGSESCRSSFFLLYCLGGRLSLHGQRRPAGGAQWPSGQGCQAPVVGVAVLTQPTDFPEHKDDRFRALPGASSLLLSRDPGQSLSPPAACQVSP